MPDRTLRRALVALVACASLATFGGALAAIASTDAALRPGGETALIAERQREAQTTAVRDCRPPDAAQDEASDEIAL